MKNCKYLIYFFLIFNTLPTFSQSWESIKHDTLYIFGEGVGSTMSEADQSALNDLIGKISMQVSSSSSQTIEESVVNGELESKESFGMLMSTYSQATLTNTEKMIIKDDFEAGEYIIGRYIKRSEIERIFEGRKNKIKSMVELALRAESKGQVDNALRNFYWALILTKSLQHPNEAVFVDENKDSHLLMTWIPEMMDNIFREIDVRTIRKKINGEVDLSFHYKNIPVNSLDYIYFDGRDWTSICSAKDGKGVLEMSDVMSRSVYQLQFEYEYRGQIHLDNELESVIGLVKGIPMRGSRITVDAEVVDEPKPVLVAAPVAQPQPQATDSFYIAQSVNAMGDIVEMVRTNSFSTVDPDLYKMPEPVEDPTEYKKILSKVVAAIKVGTKEAAMDYFTEEGIDIYERLLLYGKARILGEPEYTFCRLGEDVVARGLTMSFSFNPTLPIK